MKKYLPVIVALGAPLLFVVGVFFYVAFFTPSISPQYDFIMTNYGHVLFVDDNKLQVDEDRLTDYYRNRGDIWYYSVEEDSVRKITLPEAEQLYLDDNRKSPDGFTVEYRHSPNIGILFGGTNQRGYYIYKENKGRKLNIDDWGTQFFAWVIN